MLWMLLLATIFLAGCDSGGSSVMCGADRVRSATLDPGTLIVAVRSGDDCHVLNGFAAFEPGSENSINRAGEPTFLMQFEGKETRLTLWFAREGQGRLPVGTHRISDLPDEPAGRFETRFVTNAMTVSAMGLHVSGHQAFSEAGTLTFEASEEDRMAGRFEMTMDLEDANEDAYLLGRFAAVPADLGYPIIL